MVATREHDDKGRFRASYPLDKDEPEARGIGGEGPEVTPLLLPAPVGVGYTVTVANPTPPTNIAYVSYGTGPMETMLPAVNPHDPAWVPGTAFTAPMLPTLSGDVALINTAAASVPAIGLLTVCAAPSGGTGPGPEAIPITVVTAPGSRIAPYPPETWTQSVSVTQSGSNAYTSTPNATHASAKAPAVTPTITGYVPASPASAPGGGTTSLIVNGTGFYPSSQVVIGGVPYNTQYNSATQLMVLNAPRRTSAGSTAVYVTTNGTAIAPTNWTFT